jgi:hypothetical protein
MGIPEQHRDLPETDGSQFAIVDSELERWRAGEIPSVYQLSSRVTDAAAVADRELAARRELRCIQRRLDPGHYAVRPITRVGGADTVARRVTRARGVRRRVVRVRAGHVRRPARRRRVVSRSAGGGSSGDPGGGDAGPGEGAGAERHHHLAPPRESSAARFAALHLDGWGHPPGAREVSR